MTVTVVHSVSTSSLNSSSAIPSRPRPAFTFPSLPMLRSSSSTTMRKPAISAPSPSKSFHASFARRDTTSTIPSSSSADASFPLNEREMRRRAIQLTDALLHDSDLIPISKLLAPKLRFQLDSPSAQVDLATRDEFLAFCEERNGHPFRGDFVIKDAAVDVGQRKAWLVGVKNLERNVGDESTSEIEEQDTKVVEIVEMVRFDLEGRICEIMDWKRKVRVRKENRSGED